MKVYDAITPGTGEPIPLTHLPVCVLEEMLRSQEWVEGGEAPTTADYDAQVRIIISLKRRGFLP